MRRHFLLAPNIVFILITMVLLALPAMLYFSQRNSVGDLRNRAAEVYDQCVTSGYQCVPAPVECTDSGGTLISLTCTSGYCCNFGPTITPSTTLIPSPTTPSCLHIWTCGAPDPNNPVVCQGPMFQYQEDEPFCLQAACPEGQIVCEDDIGGCCGGGGGPTPTSGGGLTPTNTPKPPPPPTATVVPGQCLNIKIYKNGVVVDPNTLRPGDQVILAVMGTTNTTKAHFRVNGSAWTETSTKNAAGEYIIAYTIPSGIVHILVEAEVFANGIWY